MRDKFDCAKVPIRNIWNSRYGAHKSTNTWRGLTAWQRAGFTFTTEWCACGTKTRAKQKNRARGYRNKVEKMKTRACTGVRGSPVIRTSLTPSVFYYFFPSSFFAIIVSSSSTACYAAKNGKKHSLAAAFLAHAGALHSFPCASLPQFCDIKGFNHGARRGAQERQRRK